jgi:hypothetical protein
MMDEEDRIREDATWRATITADVESLKGTRKTMMWAIGAAIATVISQMWEQIKGVFFNGQ